MRLTRSVSGVFVDLVWVRCVYDACMRVIRKRVIFVFGNIREGGMVSRCDGQSRRQQHTVGVYLAIRPDQ